jgi:hypothetical protein
MQNVPIMIILGLLRTEGGHLGEESRNTDGSYDLGPMQINNKAWLATVAKMHFNGDQDLAYRALRDHGCYNVHIGTWIYRQALDEAHGNYAEAIGLYHSHTASFKERYKGQFAKNFVAMVQSMQALIQGKR